jgi:hypothetical protein
MGVVPDTYYLETSGGEGVTGIEGSSVEAQQAEVSEILDASSVVA